jgi:acyl carrier protein
MTSPTQDKILDDLRDLLRNFNGREYSEDIGLETLLFGDIGMVSIEAVILAETLEQLYERQFAFGQFLAELNREGVKDVHVGRLVAFLYGQMSAEIQPCP